jgi:para-nitrobenzyl esterase
MPGRLEGDAVVTVGSTSRRRWSLLASLAAAALLIAVSAGPARAQVKTVSGALEGTTADGGRLRVFKGVPYAAPPVGALRWRAPQPVSAWTGVRKADAFGAQCHQPPIFGDIVFDRPASEDCLYLNLWTPAKDAAAALPVMVWIHGGGYQAGASHEPRHDGQRLANKGVVLVTINYRLGVFGFFAHPALSKDDPRGASGNYGVLDMIAALQWIRDNIAAFGGDPGNVTIFGESAGSFAVSTLMAAPQARGLFHKVIGESGAPFGPTLSLAPRQAAEGNGEKFASTLAATTADALRATPAEAVLAAAAKWQPWFSPSVDGVVLAEPVAETFAAGRQAKVPLLAGWNADEARAGVVLGKETPTAASFTEQTRKRFGPAADMLLQVYPARTDAEALESAASLAGDLFIGYGTWKWIEAHRATGDAPVYRYLFARKIPVPAGHLQNGRPATAGDIGARHAGEIEYVFGTLDSVKGVPWTDADRTLSEAIGRYWTNFARTGDPNGEGLPAWPRLGRVEPGAMQDMGPRLIQLDTNISAMPEPHRARYEVLDKMLAATAAANSR